MVHVCARTRNFLNAPGIHYFPSRVWLDVYHLRLRLFPEPLLRSLKSGNSPTAQTARIFTFTSQMLFFGNNLRLDGTHLRSDELFCRQLFYTTSLPEWSDVFDVSLHCSLTVFSEGRYLALLPFQSGAMIFTFTSQMLFFGNNLRLDGTHLRLDELFSEGHCPRTSRKDFTKREKRIGSFLCSTGFE